MAKAITSDLDQQDSVERLNIDLAQRMEWIDLRLRAWARWLNTDRREIRKMTGCGPGHIDEAGPPARRVYGAPALGEVHQAAPVSLDDPTGVEEVDLAFNRLSGRHKLVIQAEYLNRYGTQAQKAQEMHVTLECYKQRLRRARLAIAELLQ